MQKVKKIAGRPVFWMWIALIVGSILRLTALNRWPMGLHQDEAFSAYNAWNLMQHGIDLAGYSYPVYYPVYGSGMSVLYSYLTMPLFALFGISTVTIRLPQAVLGCLSIYAVYELGKEILDEKFGVVFAMMLAINPWHIKQSRFGWDANLAVPFFLFAVLFLCRYLNGKKKSVIGAGICFGFTLYCYALTWMLVPFFLLVCLVFFWKKIRFDKYTWTAIVVLFVLALPLLLFLAVNFGLLDEIRTPFLSIPRLGQMRTDEISLQRIKENVAWNAVMLVRQYDDIWWNTSRAVGSYYYISTPFILLGIAAHVKTLWQSLRAKKALPLHFLMALWFVVMVALSCTIKHAKFYKLNELHIPVIFYTVYGIWNLLHFLKKNKVIVALLVIAYVVSFGWFLYDEIGYPVDYENYGQSAVARMHWNDYEEALEAAKAKTDGDIGIINLSYVNVLLHERYSPHDFMQEAVYEGDDMAFRTLRSVGRFHFEVWPSEQTREWVFVIPYNLEDMFLQAGYSVEPVTKCYGIAYGSN